jgi:HSP20 family protein
MAVIRWNPTSDLMNLHSEMDRIFGELTESLGIAPRAQTQNGGGREDTAFLPIDVERSDDAVIIRASVPGLSPDEVEVTVDRGVLTIDAQRKRETEKREGKLLRRERFSGRLYRQIMLGEGLKENEAQATFEHGELTVRIPMAERPQPKRIPVQPGATLTAQAQSKQSKQSEESRQAATTRG